MCIVRWYNTMARCINRTGTGTILHHSIAVNPCRDQSEPVAEPYDKVFSDPTIELIAKQLNDSPYRVLVTYQRPDVWRRLGLRDFLEAKSLTMRTTGGQNFKAYVFLNANATA